MTRKQLVTRFHLFLLVVLAAITATAYVKIRPGMDLPVHWGFDGKPDQTWPRNTALLMFPALGVVLTAIFAAIGQFAPVERIEPGRVVSGAILVGLLGLLCALQFALILIGVGSEIDLIRIAAFIVAVALILVGAMLFGAQQNAYGSTVHLPWTITSPANWTASHRITGALVILGGLGLGGVAWLKPDPADMLLAMAAAVFLPAILGGLFSLLRSRF